MDLAGSWISLMISIGYEVDFLFFSKNVIIRHKQGGQRKLPSLRSYFNGRKMKEPIMALKRNKSNIINLALAVSNEDGKAGMTIDQTILNGRSMAVAFRLINGAKKSGAVKLDRQACADLVEALQEVLATDGEF